MTDPDKATTTAIDLTLAYLHGELPSFGPAATADTTIDDWATVSVALATLLAEHLARHLGRAGAGVYLQALRITPETQPTPTERITMTAHGDNQHLSKEERRRGLDQVRRIAAEAKMSHSMSDQESAEALLTIAIEDAFADIEADLGDAGDSHEALDTGLDD